MFSVVKTQRKHCRFFQTKVDNKTRYENKSSYDDLLFKRSRNRLARKLINGKYHQRPSPLPIESTQFADIRNEIKNQCNNTTEIFRILRSPSAKKNNYDHTVYVCAMKKCENISRNYRVSESIMKLMYDNNIERNVIVYNEFFKILTKYGKLEIALKYFNYMIKIDKISPTIITATILIGACKESLDYKLATKIWDIVIKKYNLLPDSMCYTQLISVYCNSCKIKLALNLFNQMLNDNILPSITCYGSMINGYLKVNQLENAIKILKLIHENDELKYEITHAQYTPFISYYLRHNKPLKALKIYDQCIKLMMNKKYDLHNNKNKFDSTYLLKYDESLQYLRSVIYVQLIKEKYKDTNNIHDKEIKEWFHILFNVIPNERESMFGLNRINHRLSHLQLQIMLLFYEDNNIEKVIDFFENDLLKTESFGMWKYQKEPINNWVIDLHLMTFDVTKFILKYLFKYEKNNIFDLDTEKLYILCGKGKHRILRHGNNGKDHENNIKSCVIDEFASWDPVIVAKTDSQDNAFVTIDLRDIINFYKDGGEEKLL